MQNPDTETVPMTKQQLQAFQDRANNYHLYGPIFGESDAIALILEVKLLQEKLSKVSAPIVSQ